MLSIKHLMVQMENKLERQNQAALWVFFITKIGEIFDHGVDALCLTLFMITIVTIDGYFPENSNKYNILFTYINMWISFYASHWEHYHSGKNNSFF
jgi:hypothetical protein